MLRLSLKNGMLVVFWRLVSSTSFYLLKGRLLLNFLRSLSLTAPSMVTLFEFIAECVSFFILLVEGDLLASAGTELNRSFRVRVCCPAPTVAWPEDVARLLREFWFCFSFPMSLNLCNCFDSTGCFIIESSRQSRLKDLFVELKFNFLA